MEIKKGTKATVYIGSDRYGLEVVKLSSSGKTIFCRYLAREKIIKVRKFQDGKYRYYGNQVNWQVVFGKADDYRDPSF